MAIFQHFENVPEAFDRVRQHVTTEAVRLGLGDLAVQELVLALGELISNIRQHAYPSGEAEPGFALALERAGATLHVRLRHWGLPPAPDAGAAFDLGVYKAKRQRRGLGLFLVRSLVDAMEVSRVDDATELVLTKRL